MGFQVTLVDDQQPVLVAQVAEARVGRVVAGPHGVDVVPFHQHHVRPHGGLVQRAAGLGVPLVPVHAAELHGPAVEPDLAAGHLDAAEADPEADLAGRAGQGRGVQPGPLVGPGLDGGDVVVRAGGDAIQAEFGDRQGGRDISLDAQQARAGVRVVVGMGEEVPDRTRRLAEHAHAAEDAGQPPHVLVFQVRPGRPLVHADRDDIVAGPDQRGDVELPHEPAAHAVAGGGPVDEQREAGVHALETDHRRPAEVPVRRKREGPPVLSGGVGVGHMRRVDREGIGHVGVSGPPVAGRTGHPGQLPQRRHSDVAEPGVIELGGLEPRGQVVQAAARPESPGPVQAELAAPPGLPGAGLEVALPGAKRLDVSQAGVRHPVGHGDQLVRSSAELP